MHPIAALDLPIERDDDGEMSHAAITGAATRLGEHVAWHERARSGTSRDEPPVDADDRRVEPAEFPTDQFRDG